MIQKGLGVGVVLFFLVLAGCGQDGGSFNSSVKESLENVPADPQSQGPFEQSVGAPWQGQLVNGTDIGFSGPGYVKLFKNRGGSWATFDLIYVIKKAISKLREEFPQSEAIQIGDLSKRGGGRLAGHQSHQSGVDADIRFLSKDHRVQLDSINTGFDEDFVVKGKVTADFDFARNWTFLKALYSTGRLNRIFVATPIKKALCNYASFLGERNSYSTLLRHLQVLDNHIDHMHVRITCPRNSPRCEDQEPVPPETDCP